MRLTLIEKKEEIPGVTSFVFEPSEPLSWQAGQYLHYSLPHEHMDDRGIERWFTVASAPFEGKPMITTRLSGEKGSSFKRALAALEIGASIEANGPEGDFTIEDAAREYVFIAGGIGITPFHSILKQADHEGKQLQVNLLYANRDANPVFKGELESFAARNPALKINYLIEPERLTQESIRRLVPDLSAPLFYISGPEPMVKSLASVLEGMGVSADRVKLDDFPGYPLEGVA